MSGAMLLCLAIALLPSAVRTAAADSEKLVMFYEPGCAWCAVWEREIGAVYSRTEEGQAAPLRRVDMTEGRPPDLAFVRAVAFSPTFVLVEGRREVGRIVGYPGSHFFWPMLQELLTESQESNTTE